MNRTKQIYGFRLGESIPKWVDRFGKGGGKIIKLIYLQYSNKLQLIISNGDVLTDACMTGDVFFARNLNNDDSGFSYKLKKLSNHGS